MAFRASRSDFVRESSTGVDLWLPEILALHAGSFEARPSHQIGTGSPQNDESDAACARLRPI